MISKFKIVFVLFATLTKTRLLDVSACESFFFEMFFLFISSILCFAVSDSVTNKSDI